MAGSRGATVAVLMAPMLPQCGSWAAVRVRSEIVETVWAAAKDSPGYPFTLLLQLEVVRGSRKHGDCLGSVAGGAVAGQGHWK